LILYTSRWISKINGISSGSILRMEWFNILQDYILLYKKKWFLIYAQFLASKFPKQPNENQWEIHPLTDFADVKRMCLVVFLYVLHLLFCVLFSKKNSKTYNENQQETHPLTDFADYFADYFTNVKGVCLVGFLVCSPFIILYFILYLDFQNIQWEPMRNPPFNGFCRIFADCLPIICRR
jgi:hypothetical protein